MEIADRIAVMNHGRIEQVGAPRELYERPANDVRDGLPRARSPQLGGQLVRPHDLALTLRAARRRARGDGRARRAPRLRGPRRARAGRRRRACACSSRAARPRSSSWPTGDIVLGRAGPPRRRRRWRSTRPPRSARDPGRRGRGQRARRRRAASPATMSASVTCSSTVAQVRAQRDPDARQRLRRAGVADVPPGAWPRTEASGPSTARITSATVTSSAGRASQ